jgi:precorrin-3B C17-methyltransferase
MLEHQDMLGMITTVIVGNSSTFIYDGMMINPRGYRSKYDLIKEEVPVATTSTNMNSNS